MLTRSDGVSLIYAGKVHSLNSESEAGKTWVALLASVQVMAQGCHVVFVDFEDSAESVVGRLLDMNVAIEVIEALFHYVRPDEPLSEEAWKDFAPVFEAHDPALTVVDGVTEAMVVHGYSINDNDDVAKFMERVLRPIARSGSAVLVLDHVTKDKDSRGRHAIGAQHKLSGVDGAVYSMTATRPFGRGKPGESKLKVAKDRPGHVRPHSTGTAEVATVQFLAGDGGALEVRLLPVGQGSTPTPEQPPEVETLRLVSDTVRKGCGVFNTQMILDSVPKREQVVRAALKWLTDKGFIEKQPGGQGKPTTYVELRPFTGEDGDQ